MYHPHDDLSILVTLKSTGTIEKTVVGSVMESLELDSNNEAAYARLREIFGKDSLQMASFTITEKGYSLVNGKGEMVPAVVSSLLSQRAGLRTASQSLSLRLMSKATRSPSPGP